MKLILLALLAIVLFPLFRRLGAKSPQKAGTADEEAEQRAKDARFTQLLRTVVVLEDNDWTACALDGIAEDWPRYAEERIRGFAAVPAGRHRVVTTVLGKEAVLDFVVHPGEVFVRRLDRATMTWAPLAKDEEERVAIAASGGEKGQMARSLVSYGVTMGVARVKTGKVKSPDAALEAAKTALARGLDRARETEDVDAIVRDLKTAGEALIGIPLVDEQLEALVETVLERARLFEGKRAAMLAVGRAILPGERRFEG